MEIHAPEKPILTIKEAAVHLLIVTVGILIALSLEGVVEYAHHRIVVREARDVMRHEIEDNEKELAQTLAQIKDKQIKELSHDIDLVASIAAGEKPAKLDLLINYRAANLRSTGRATAELMGAFAYMDYREVSRWADVYDRQAEFLSRQSVVLTDGTLAYAFLMKRDLMKTPPAQLEIEADNLRRNIGSMVVAMQLGASLENKYGKILSER